jgi:hypothetical protein
MDVHALTPICEQPASHGLALIVAGTRLCRHSLALSEQGHRVVTRSRFRLALSHLRLERHARRLPGGR